METVGNSQKSGMSRGCGYELEPGLAGDRLAPEVVELVLAEPPLEERAGVDAGRRVALEEDLVAGLAVVLAAEEVVEADLVQAGRGGVRREVAADAGEPAVRAQHHRRRVPADDPADPPLHLLVAREVRLLLGADRVDVAGLGQRRQPDLELARALQQLVDEEPGAVSPACSTTWSSDSIHSWVSSGSMSGSWCLNSSKYMGYGPLRVGSLG